MVPSAEAPELLEGHLACLYRGSRPGRPSCSSKGELQLPEAPRSGLGPLQVMDSQGRLRQRGRETCWALVQHPPRSPAPQHTMGSQKTGGAFAGLAQPPFLPRRLCLGVGGRPLPTPTSAPAQTPMGLSLWRPCSLPGPPVESTWLGYLPHRVVPPPKIVQVSCLPCCFPPSPWAIPTATQDRPWGVRETFRSPQAHGEDRDKIPKPSEEQPSEVGQKAGAHSCLPLMSWEHLEAGGGQGGPSLPFPAPRSSRVLPQRHQS